jgi:hypothetical protein
VRGGAGAAGTHLVPLARLNLQGDEHARRHVAPHRLRLRGRTGALARSARRVRHQRLCLDVGAIHREDRCRRALGAQQRAVRLDRRLEGNIRSVTTISKVTFNDSKVTFNDSKVTFNDSKVTFNDKDQKSLEKGEAQKTWKAPSASASSPLCCSAFPRLKLSVAC